MLFADRRLPPCHETARPVQVGGSLRALSLQWNCLRGTEGVEALTGLRSLDLGYNFVAVIGEVVRLSGATPMLTAVVLATPHCTCSSQIGEELWRTAARAGTPLDHQVHMSSRRHLGPQKSCIAIISCQARFIAGVEVTVGKRETAKGPWNIGSALGNPAFSRPTQRIKLVTHFEYQLYVLVSVRRPAGLAVQASAS